MKFIMKSLIEALHKPRSMYRPAIFLRQSSKRGPSQNKRGSGELGLSKVIIGIALFPGFAYFGYQMYQLYYDVKKEIIVGNIKNKLKQVSNVTEREAGEFKEGLPFYSVGEISKHNSMNSRVWITYRQGVYDITDFIKLHPGGQQILKAAGSTVAPFFHIYPVHQSETVYTILERYRIGNLQAEDLSERADDDDPYSRDPVRHAALHAIVNKPFNGGTDPALLVQSFYTPNELFYVRNHLYVPDLDPATYKFELQVEGESQSYTFTLDDIKKMPKHTVNGALMCIGNRRTEMLKVKPMTGVVHWNNSAISCASWTGVRLRDVLKIAGVDGENEKHKHVHVKYTTYSFKQSLPLEGTSFFSQNIE